MGVLVTYAFMGEASQDVALETGATIADLSAHITEDGARIPKGSVISLGGCEVGMETPLRTSDVVFFSKPVYEG